MTTAGRALPELIRRPLVLWRGVLQVHLGAASLTTHTDVGMVHGEILVYRGRRVTRDPVTPSSLPDTRSMGT